MLRLRTAFAPFHTPQASKLLAQLTKKVPNMTVTIEQSDSSRTRRTVIIPYAIPNQWCLSNATQLTTLLSLPYAFFPFFNCCSLSNFRLFALNFSSSALFLLFVYCICSNSFLFFLLSIPLAR